MARHRAKNPGPGRKVMTAEEREASRQRKLARGRQYALERRLADPDGAKVKAREQYKLNGRKHNLKWKFGITPERYDEMLVEQSGRCYLCEEPLRGGVHIDHDHRCCPGNKSCGKCIRGLACQKCNQGVGQFGDDPDRMEMVARNLRLASR